MGEIKLDAHNYRIHDERNLKLIKKSLKECGAGRSILIDADGEIIAGNATYKTAQELGIPVETIKIDGSKIIALQRTDLHTQDKERKQMALMDNTTSDKFIKDMEKINTDFSADELPALGVDDIPSLIDENVEVQEVDVPDQVETRVKKGDIWQLGEHRLMCGDSTVITDVEKLMNGEKADMVFTDPPYGVSYAEKNEFLNSAGTGHRLTRAIENDSKSPTEMYDFWIEAFKNIYAFTTDKVSYYITAPQGGDLLLLLLQAIRDSGFALKHQLVWNKNNHVLGRCDYNYKHEPIIYGWKLDGTHTFYGNGKMKTSVWDFPKPHQSKLHPTMKPVELIGEALLNSSKQNDLIIDLFGGSGSTLIACEQLKRKCYMCEIDPHYCDVIITRWETLTGKQAQRIE